MKFSKMIDYKGKAYFLCRTGRINCRILEPGQPYEKSFVVPIKKTSNKRPATSPRTMTTTSRSKTRWNSPTRPKTRNSQTNSSRSSDQEIRHRGAGQPGPRDGGRVSCYQQPQLNKRGQSMLKINCGLSRKVSKDYNSTGFR